MTAESTFQALRCFADVLNYNKRQTRVGLGLVKTKKIGLGLRRGLRISLKKRGICESSENISENRDKLFRK